MIKISLLEKEDFNKIVEWNANKTEDDLLQWAGPMYKYPLTLEQIENYFSNEVKNNNFNIYVYKIQLTSTNEVIGTIELREIDKNKRIGKICRFLIGEYKHRGKGIGQEALKEILRIGFEDMNFEKITLVVFDFNQNAIKCYEKLGFKKEKLRENVRNASTGYWNLYDMVILKSDWESKNSKVTTHKSQEDILNYYKDELKWNPPFAEALSKYSNDALKGYLIMRESVQNGHLPKKTRELIFTILDSLDDEVSGAKAHAVAAIEAGLTMEELVEAFVIVTIVKGINVLCKAGTEAIKAAEKKAEEIKLSSKDN